MQTKKIHKTLRRWQERMQENQPSMRVRLKSSVRIITFVVLLVGIVGFMLYGQDSLDLRRQATGSVVQLKFSPEKLKTSPTASHDIDIIIDSGSNKITGAELHISSLSSDTVIINSFQAVHPNLSVKVNESNTSNSIVVSIVPTCTDNCTYLSGRQVIGRISITAINPGQTQLIFGGTLISALGQAANSLGNTNNLEIRVQ